MDAHLREIKGRVKSIKESVFSPKVDTYSLLAPSAYDTAWLAMIPHSNEAFKPMFGDCLDWVLNNQNELGFWGDCDHQQKPTMESLTSTLACIIALKTWNIGHNLINNGLDYIYSTCAKKLLKETENHCPIYFAIIFPGMVEIALDQFNDLKIELDLSHLFRLRNQILEKKLASKYQLMSCIEAIPSRYTNNDLMIINDYLDDRDGSLFQSPSATAFAYMSTRNSKCLRYLESLVHRFSNKGVPSSYPIDEEFIKLCVINHIQRLGLSEHFEKETEEILEQVYKSYCKGETYNNQSAVSIHQKLLKDSLAFRLLRVNGYDVLPLKVCTFLFDEEVREFIENNYEYFVDVLLNIHRATDVMFLRETELQKVKAFSRNLLDQFLCLEADDQSPFRKLIKHELDLPWMARMEHLEHRLWIEESKSTILWTGKTSFQRLSRLHNAKLLKLAAQNYELRQVIYKTELDEMKSWSKETGLSKMGFGREKTTYCYFAVAASSSLPYDSDIRIIAAKSAILITVADDFFDMKGSDLDELRSLTHAIMTWDGQGLSGHSKVIFDALDNLVSEMAVKYFNRKGIDLTSYLRAIWHETFQSWLTETQWGKSENRMSMDEYLRVGMTSIAAHTIVLPALYFLNQTLIHDPEILNVADYDTITKLVMIITRLLNDIQSYEREKNEGNVNSVLLYMETNPDADIEEAVAYVREMLKEKSGEFVEHVFMGGHSDFPKDYRLLHLSCLRVFQMFFNSSNRFDSETEMLDDIAKAIYVPIESGLISKKLLQSTSTVLKLSTKRSPVNLFYGDYRKSYKKLSIKSVALPIHRGPKTSIRIFGERKSVFTLNCMRLSFV